MTGSDAFDVTAIHDYCDWLGRLRPSLNPVGVSDRRAKELRSNSRRCAPPTRARNQSEMHSVSRSDAHLSTKRLRARSGDL